MASFSKSKMVAQAKMFGGAAVGASPLSDILYVDSANGSDGNDGASRVHPFATLPHALTQASAGDTIILAAGGSETVTATVAVSLARVKIVCIAPNPESGYTISGAGTLDLMTVSAADVQVEGLKFAHTGATSSAAGIITTAAADRLRVKGCLFDDSAITTTFTGFGVEVTDDTDGVEVIGCKFKDCHRAVLFATATAKNQIGARVRDNEFWVGRATAFGVHASPAGTGTVRGLVISENVFIEANGDGDVATDAWDGTDGTDAASGPILFGATVDQYVIADNEAYTALATSFDLLNAINSGAAGDLVRNHTGAGGDIEDKVDTMQAELSGAAGIAAWPAAAAPANAVSLAEAVRFLSENQGFRVATKSVSPTGTGTTNLFTVTGLVEMIIVGDVTTGVTSGGAPTLEVGTSDSTAALIAQIVDATGLAANDVYHGATAQNVGNLPTRKVVNDATVIQTVGVAAPTAGTIVYHCLYRPLSSDGAVAAA